MENTVINVNEVINATKGLAIIEAEYKKLYLGLSVRARRVLDFFHKQASNEMDFYKELLLLEKDQFQTINGCGRITANELLVFHHDFKINVGRSLLTKENDASISEEWPIFDNIDIDEACKDEASDELNSNLKLDRLISRLTSDLSIKSKYPARRFLKRFNGNWGELYKRITATRFSVYSIYGVGKVNGPEIRQWLERVKSVIQQHAITPQSKQSVSIASVSKGADSTTSDLDRLIGHKLESDDERRIKDMTDNLSKRSRTVVNRLIKQAGGNIGNFYRRLTDEHFSVQKLEGVGIKSVLEMYKWTEEIKEIIRPYYLAQRHSLKDPIRIPDQFTDVFSLDGFLNDISNKTNEYRSADEYIHIRDFIYPNCNGVYKEALFAELETICIDIINKHFPIAITDKKLVFLSSK